MLFSKVLEHDTHDLLRVPALIGWGKGGNVTSAGWQVIPCDPIWHVSSRSGVVLVAQTAIRFLTLPYPREDVTRMQRRKLLPWNSSLTAAQACRAPLSQADEYETNGLGRRRRTYIYSGLEEGSRDKCLRRYLLITDRTVRTTMDLRRHNRLPAARLPCTLHSPALAKSPLLLGPHQHYNRYAT